MFLKDIQDRYMVKTGNYLLRTIKDTFMLIPIYWDLKEKPSILTTDGFGAEIWNLISRRIKIREFVEIIAKRHDLMVESVLTDFEEFIFSLIESKAIQIEGGIDLPRTDPVAGIDSEDFLYRIIKEEFKGKSWPASLTWEVSGRCNLNCVHCYMVNREERIYVPELTLDEINDLVQQISEASCIQTIITGGEPFYRGDLTEILLRLKKEGILY